MNNSKTKSLFTFLGVALVAISLPITVYILKTGNFDFRINAFESDEPVQVQISDVSATSFKASWITERPVTGGIKLNNVIEPVMESNSVSYHSVTVRNLNPGTDYSWQLLSNGRVFDQSYSITTATQNATAPNRWLLGQVFSKDGVSTQNGGLITLQLSRADQKSQLLSTVVNETGGFKFNIGNIINQGDNDFFNWHDNVDLILNIYTEAGQAPITKTFTLDLNKEIQIPNIYLGDVSIDIIPGGEGN